MTIFLPKLAGAAALSAMIGLLVGCADGNGAKTNHVKVAQYLEDAVPQVRAPLPGVKPPMGSPSRTRGEQPQPTNETPTLLADADGVYATPAVGAQGYLAATDDFSNGAGSARGPVGRVGSGGSGGSGVVAVTGVALAESGSGSSLAGAAKAGQAGQALPIAGNGEQLIAAVDDASTGGRSDFNSLVPTSGSSNSAPNQPAPVTSGAELPAPPVVAKPPVVSAPPPAVASTDSSPTTPATSPASPGAAPTAPGPNPGPNTVAGPPSPTVTAGTTPPPAAPSPSTVEPPVLADLTPPAPGTSTTDAPVAGRPGSGAGGESPSVTELPLSADALLPTDMEWPLSADNSGIEGGPNEGPDVTQIPSPATALLMLAGFAGMGWARRRRR